MQEESRHSCRYSKAMDQPYPRLCVDCGKPEDAQVKEKHYYIQNGWVGNAILWWAKDRKGYTTEITSAHRFTEAEAIEIIKRPQDVAWDCDHVDGCKEAHRHVVDGQYLDHRHRLEGETK